jgi:endogenous inhibitor of DNA gyrase (YacG/DUF329 family)
MSTLRCPICEKKFDSTESQSLPFCSSRCQQVDLNRWLTEGYAMPVDLGRESEPDEEDFEKN